MRPFFLNCRAKWFFLISGCWDFHCLILFSEPKHVHDFVRAPWSCHAASQRQACGGLVTSAGSEFSPVSQPQRSGWGACCVRQGGEQGVSLTVTYASLQRLTSFLCQVLTSDLPLSVCCAFMKIPLGSRHKNHRKSVESLWRLLCLLSLDAQLFLSFFHCERWYLVHYMNRPLAQWRCAVCQNPLPDQSWIKLCVNILDQIYWPRGSSNKL